MQNIKISESETNSENLDRDQLAIKSLKNTVLRNKIFIFSFVTISTILGIISSYIEKPIYKGNFQIFITKDKQNKNNLAFLENPLIKSNLNDNKTQEFILKSPSVLKPVFNYVKNRYRENGKDVEELSYKLWLKNSLYVGFESGTNILNIEFKDHDKILIIDTLSLISEKYQSYSRRDKRLTLTKTINHLENQKEIYKEIAESSMKELNEFTIENGLGYIDGFASFENNFPENKVTNRTQINTPKFGQRYQSQFSLLEKYESEYANYSSLLKPNSKLLKNLLVKIENLKLSLKRPNKILTKHRELIINAKRNEDFLNEIEKNINLTNLEITKQQDPWELISDPTIDDQRVSPRRKRRAINFILGSLIFSVIAVILKEKKSGLVYEIEDLKNNLNIPYLDRIFSKSRSLSQKVILDTVKNIDSTQKSKIGFLNISTNQNEDVNKFLVELLSFIKYEQINFEEIEKFDKVVILVEKGKVNFKKLKLINTFKNIYKDKFVGWILIDNNFDVQ